MARLPIVAGRGMRISCKDPMQQRMGLPDGDGQRSGQAARTAAAGLEMRISCSDPMQQRMGLPDLDGRGSGRTAPMVDAAERKMRISRSNPMHRETAVAVAHLDAADVRLGLPACGPLGPLRCGRNP